MSNPKFGQVTCPTCGRPTAAAAYCTQCGSALPASYRSRPAGLDRDALDERIRERRSTDSPFRRGAFHDERDAAAHGYVPFTPDPLDARARREAGEEAPGPAVDHTAPGFDTPPPPPPPPPVAPQEPMVDAVEPEEAPAEPEAPLMVEPEAPMPAAPAAPPEPPMEPVAEPMAAAPPPPPARRPAPRAMPEPEYYDDEVDWRGAPPEAYVSEPAPSGVSGLGVAAFIALGVVAIGTGALLAGAFGGAAVASPTPTPVVSEAPSEEPEPTAEPTPSGDASPSSAPTPTPTLLPPGVFPDGFTAAVQPCESTPTSEDGCDSSGSEVVREVWVWVGFDNGNNDDVIGVTVLDAAGDTVGDADYALVNLDCGPNCGGWLYFRFPSLSPGDYRIEVDRNGIFAAEASFTATG